MIKEDRRLWKLILLSIVTLGIYNIVFWFQVTRDLNEMNHEEKKLKNYILVLFLSIITLGIYRWVWFFYVADRIQVTGQNMGMRIKPGPGTTLFSRLFGTFILIGPLVSDFMVIRNMNKIAKQYNQNFKKNTTIVRNSDLNSNKDFTENATLSGKTTTTKSAIISEKSPITKNTTVSGKNSITKSTIASGKNSTIKSTTASGKNSTTKSTTVSGKNSTIKSTTASGKSSKNGNLKLASKR